MAMASEGLALARMAQQLQQQRFTCSSSSCGFESFYHYHGRTPHGSALTFHEDAVRPAFSLPRAIPALAAFSHDTSLTCG